ncbi:unnamed protein product [Clonostachys rosea]|uniref:Uncharacterized protein n=1 Tax=Bionectria ochroleuca TaxID=29856 RepID=A0ABY6U036_BIOOC|nr:unnamed protein product [Clonostachys rosea]
MAPRYINKLQDQRVLIIGASTGIGFAVAEAAIEHGAHVILSSSNQGKINNAIQKLEAHIKENQLPPRTISGAVCDLANPSALEDNIKNLLEFATKDGKIDHVVFTAGDPAQIPTIENVTVEDLSKAGMVRVTGGVILAKHLPKYINQSDNSSLTITGSTTYRRPKSGWSTINAANGSMEPLTRALAVDLQPIRVNCVLPGFIKTELFDSFPEEARPFMFEAMKKEALLDRVGTAAETAEAYLYFMKAAFTTGTTAIVDGGRLVGNNQEGRKA